MAQSALVAIGSLLSDDTRSEILTALMSGRAHTGSELARHIGVGQSTVSEHLSKLLDAGMVTVEPQGRHRYFRLSSPQIAELLETLGAVTTPISTASRSAAVLGYARTCYDHLAGEIAVQIYDRLLIDGHLVTLGGALQLSPSGFELLRSIGTDVDTILSSKRPTARSCLDWTERRHHLAGGAGAGLHDALFKNKWVTRGPQPRSIRITETGRSGIAKHFILGGT